VTAMPDLGPHSAFILGAYAAVALVLSALCVWIAVEARRVREELRALEAQGIRRRSARRGDGKRAAKA